MSFCLFLFILVCSPIASSSGDKLTLLPMNVGGRVLPRDNNGLTAYEYSWPAIYFETAFKGDKLTLKFDDEKNNFQLIIDETKTAYIKKPGKLDYVVQNLTHGKHRVRLEKISETKLTTGRFLGFYSNGKAIKINARKRKIEFIGDSYTVGYGNTSDTRECDKDKVFSTTNSQLSFSALTAKHFNADYHVNASSGYGVVRNYGGGTPEKSLIALYPFSLHANNYIYSGPWVPQVIVIGLGTNDFSTELKDGERWSSRQELRADYLDKYTEFVKFLHRKNTSAYFVLMASDKMEGEIAEQVEKVVEKVKLAGINRIDKIIFKGLDYQGCHWHPSRQDDKRLAELLINLLEERRPW